MRKIILATAALLAVSSASAFAESDNTTLQSLRHQQLIETNQGVDAGATSFGLSNPDRLPDAASFDAAGQPIGQSREAIELRRLTYGD